MAWLNTINWLYSASGFAVGMLVGMTGVGGGSLMTPLLVLLFGFHPATAVGTDLLYAGLTKSGGTLIHGFNRTIDWQITRRLASGSLPGAALTILALSYVGRNSPNAASAINTVLGAFLGVMVTMTSVGACSIGVTVLLVLYPRLPTVRIVGSDIAHAVPLTLLAGAGHWYIGSVDWSLLTSLLIGSLPGIAIGSQVAARIPDRILRPVLAGTLAVVGAKLAF